MRILFILSSLLMLAACSSMAMSGSSGGSAQSQPDRTASVIESDNSISSRIRAELSRHSMTRATSLEVSTYNGTVTLSGTVRKHVSRDEAANIAKNTAGVVAVNNLINVSGEDE
jgi:osmotically-inducible protein OsmY